jgi:signal transduction histidine kinase
MSIRTRLLLLILFATLVPVVVGGLRFLDLRDSEIAEARRNLTVEARQVARDLTNAVRSTAQLHYGLSRSRGIDTDNAAACSAFLAGVLKEYPQYTGLLTIRPDGSLFCDSLRTGRKLNLSDRRYFRDALDPAHPAVAVEPAFGRLTGKAVLQVAYAVRDAWGELRHVLLASLNLERFMQDQSQTLLLAGAAVVLMDARGTILTWHPDGGKLRGTSLADTPLYRFARERTDENVRENVEFGGAPWIWVANTLSDLPEAGLHVLVGVPKRDLLAKANRNLEQALIALAILWLLVFTGAWALAELGVRRPATRVIAAVQAFSGGDFGVRIGKPYPGGEIGELMVALDRAFDLMQAQRREIQALNTDLEHRVAARTAELEAANKELEAFSYSVSHDLRAPLRAIVGFSKLLIEDHGQQLDAEARRKLEVIQGEGARMGQLIDELLAFSRLGRKSMQVNELDMTELARTTFAGLNGPHERAHADFQLGVLPRAKGDRVLVRQVWTNLLSNAMKFSSKRPSPRIEVSGISDEREHVYFVRDNGAGFDPRYRTKLFGVFQRLHSSSEFPGTGVGLALVERIVVRHGGRVWADGKPDEGATFCFTLPKEQVHE